MASEQQWRSYVAAASGEASQGGQTGAPVIGSPALTTPTSNTQQVPPSQTQRSQAMEDLNNPLYFSPAENLNSVLVSPPLIGSSNYTSWCISMKIALEVKNKWCIVEGSVATPNREHAQYQAWRCCNLMVCSWIFKAVHPSIAQSVMHLDKADEVWEDLRRRFAQYDAQRISALQNEIYGLKQNSMTVSEYYTKCRTMWEEMNTLRPLPERDVNQVIRFLQGLNNEYGSLKSNILVLDPLPEVYKIYVMDEKLERQINAVSLNTMDFSQANAVQSPQTSTDDLVATVNTYNARKFTSNGSGNKPKCIFCGMNGHTIDKCYKKHGYP
ncbi:PREDICTED: uncharacterized protein LOC109148480 [Ipomoea nil]|uniref:uncharacterized protein LOC109148480 n=1 Tax=Ipomoea nil TaxID=35883 RepID=UPI0009012B6A|nr:PREDICTED: uncharacterized protein LOC109148480 [Ipomoea nil]